MLRTVVASAAVASAAAFAAPAALPTRTQVRVAMPCPSWFGFAAVITFLWTLPASAVFRSSSPESLSAAGAAAVAAVAESGLLDLQAERGAGREERPCQPHGGDLLANLRLGGMNC